MKQIRTDVNDSQPAVAKLREQYKQLFDMYLTKEDTRYFRDIKKKAWEYAYGSEEDDESISDEEAEDLYYSYMNDYEDLYYDDEEQEIHEIPPQYLTNLVARDRQYMDVLPGKGWVEQTDVAKKFKNDKFDESYGTAEVPKRSYYDNSKAFAKVSKEDTSIKELYDAVLKTMSDSNAMQTNRIYTNNYLLPQKSGGLWRLLNPSFNQLRNIADWIVHPRTKISIILDWIS